MNIRREREQIVAGLKAHAAAAKLHLSDLVATITASTIEHILDGEESLDDLEGCEKTVFGTKFEKRTIKALELPRKVSKKKNPHGLKLDTRVAGIDLDIKTTLGGSNWMVPGEARGHWLFLVKVDVKREVVSYGLLKATDENLNPGRNRDAKVSVSKVGRARIHWLDEKVPYAVAPQAVAA